ncbi:t-SNARE domain-containing protein 1-like [Lissotriton helveticus]
MESQDGQKDTAERRRKIKFSPAELQVLVEEVVKHHTKVFGKQSLHVAVSVKRSTWLDIQSKVNAIGVLNRDIDDLKKRWYDLRIITKKKLAALRKEAGVTGWGKNRAPRLTDLEELVESTLEPESIHGIGDANSSARDAKKQGESSRSKAQEREERAPTTERREKTKERAGHSAVQEDNTTAQEATTPERPTTPQPQSPLLFGTQELEPVICAGKGKEA